jgi:hypothetical protein
MDQTAVVGAPQQLYNLVELIMLIDAYVFGHVNPPS